jgi:phage tail-like protein
MAESGDRKDPFRAFNFLVEIDGVTTETGFSEVSGLSMETDAVEYRNGDEKENHVRKLTGLNKYGNITFKRGFTKDAKSLWDWRKKVIDGKTERASGTVTLLNEARETALKWEFSEAWPRKLDGPSFNAKNNEVAIESLEIVVEKLVMA